MSDLPPEFALIGRHFAPLAGSGTDGLRDDVAILTPPPGRDLILKADALVEGIHFLPTDPPDLIARKLLRVNLSDLAGKGAIPIGYLVTISVPRGTSDAWFAAFAAGLAQDQREFSVHLLGGDTTSTPGPISLSLTVIGHAEPGKTPRRGGGSAGDEIWVTGTIGDGALGLAVAQGRLTDSTGHLLNRYQLPRPRLGLALGGLARASMDISDGLVQDLSHICRHSNLAAEIEVARVPLSPPARAAGPDWLETILTGGDDYEILLAAPPARAADLAAAAERAGIALTCIGRLISGAPEVRVLDTHGQRLILSTSGWSHF
ncbi:MAG: thiamine-phosphate kinase [Acetobacteraceae bacterium]|nr:thiamine-phosphate kinase [Acetobacteraceae bacterium]MSP29473.1 thiamine-phosphate kinase [Acetobacteraceae bacterium]